MNSDSVNRSRVPRVPKLPPRPLTSSSPEQQPPVPQPPPPPLPVVAKLAPPVPPPPPPKTAKSASPLPPPPLPKRVKPLPAKVRRVPEVVEFYHSLMRRESRRESCNGSSTADALSSTANTRDMIGEIENRWTHLLAVSYVGRVGVFNYYFAL
ncbi:putative protein CHUP1 [Helianthus debilis subsp. tardiflorus]